jgi:hypothetical protein
MSKTQYTDEQRQEALRLYVEVGPSEAGRQLHIPAVTITSWARAGIQSEAPAATRAAVEMARLTRIQKREQLIDGMHETALDLFARGCEPHEDFKVTKDGIERIAFEQPTPERSSPTSTPATTCTATSASRPARQPAEPRRPRQTSSLPTY